MLSRERLHDENWLLCALSRVNICAGNFLIKGKSNNNRDQTEVLEGVFFLSIFLKSAGFRNHLYMPQWQ